MAHVGEKPSLGGVGGFQLQHGRMGHLGRALGPALGRTQGQIVAQLFQQASQLAGISVRPAAAPSAIRLNVVHLRPAVLDSAVRLTRKRSLGLLVH